MKPLSELAYDSIRAGAPGLSDATCKVIAASIARKAQAAPAAEQKRTMTLALTDREMVALEQVMANKDLSAPAVFRNSFRLYQAVDMGAAVVTWPNSGPLSAPDPFAAEDACLSAAPADPVAGVGVESGLARVAVVNIIERHIQGWAGEYADNPYDAAPVIAREILAALAPSPSVEKLVGALERHDAKAAECRIDGKRPQRDTMAPCDLCGADMGNGCGRKAGAAYTFIAEVREALAQAKGGV